uniref:CCHC-type domain-containing protein n=1 Tax=Tanacetum cinerariifolium TaxID=118510 RepID=A0A699GQB8_TANCI|nr:hypothetical protein [Tanacetum cinerariifolium]
MVALLISISSNVSVESVGSSFPRVILIGYIFVDIPVASEVGATAVASPAEVLELDTYSSSEADPYEISLPLVSVAPMVSPFLCSNDSESDTEMPERHELPTPHDSMLTRSFIFRSFIFDHSSPRHSILGHSLSAHTPPDTTIADSSTPPRFVYPPLARALRCSEAYHLWRSPVATVTSYIHASIALVPSRADLLPPRKRFRDYISPEDTVEEDIDTYALADIEVDAIAVEVAIDRDVEAGINVGIGMEVDVGFDIKDEVESSDRGTMKVEEVAHDIYGHVMEIPLQRVASLERSNTRPRGTVRMESARADRFWRRMSFIESELRQIRRFRYYDRMRFRRLETFATRCLEAIEELIYQQVVEALATYEATRAAEVAVESQSQNGADDDNRNVRGNGNGNGKVNGDENGGGNGNGNIRGNENGNPNRNDRCVMPVARECTYHDFMMCQPLNFKGNEGVVGLTRWFEKMETVFQTSNCPERYQVKELMKLMTEVYCPRNEIQKIESELWNLTVKNNDLATYTQRFQELAMMCTKMVHEEEDQVEKFIGGLPDNIQGNNKTRFDNNQKGNRVQQPPYKRRNVDGQSVARAYTASNNEKRGYVGLLPYFNKCKLYHEGPCTVQYKKCNKVRHMTRDRINVVAATATQRASVVNQRVPTCFKCGRQGYYGSECPKLKNHTRGNKTGKKTEEARGKVYVLGGGEANPDSNVVTGTFLLNNHYASMLFDSGADRSFVLSTFSALLDVTPSTLDISYAVELADGRIQKQTLCLEKYIKNGFQIVLAQVTKKETEDKSEEKRLEDVPIVRDFPKVFLEDLSGLPPTQQVEF